MESAVGRSLQEYLPAGTTFIAVPLFAKDQIIGIFVLSYNEPGYYSRDKMDLLQAFANQAAIAIDNARLYQQVQQAAVLEERDRLARELHDAVTQTLFSASVIAKALPDIWEKDPAIGANLYGAATKVAPGGIGRDAHAAARTSPKRAARENPGDSCSNCWQMPQARAVAPSLP